MATVDKAVAAVAHRHLYTCLQRTGPAPAMHAKTPPEGGVFAWQRMQAGINP